MKRRHLLFLLFTPFLFSQCQTSISGKGNVITSDRTVSSFNEIVLKGMGNVNVTYSSDQSVQVVGYENIVPLVVTTVNNGRLEITFKKGFILHEGKIDCNITIADLKYLSLEGTGKIKTNSFNTSNVTMSLSGLGDIDATGSTCDTAYATVNGSGNILLNVTKYLDARVNGLGKIKYHGSPVVDSKVNGVGKVEPLETN